MNRSALVLFLQNVRDLEVAKHIIETQFNREKLYYENQLNNIQTVANTKKFVLEERNGGGLGFVFHTFATIIILLFLVFLYVVAFFSEEPLGFPEWLVMFMLFVAMFSGVLALYYNLKSIQ